jgi:hypothetical protein
MDSGDTDNSDEDDDDDEQEEWERSKKKPKKAAQPLKEEKRARAEPELTLAKRPEEKKRPRVDPVESKPPASTPAKRPDLATSSRTMSPRTPMASAQKQATKQLKKKTLQVPDDMQDLNVDMKESMIMRKYKMYVLREHCTSPRSESVPDATRHTQ